MDFSPSEEQKILKNTAREFFEKECPKSHVREMAKDELGYSPQLWKKMADLGWMGLMFDPQYGGIGGTFLDLILLLEEMGRALLPGPFFPTVVLSGLTIMEAGGEDIKQRLLPAICQGELILTLALTEAEGEYKKEGIKTRADKKGEDYSLTGTKLFVPFAHLSQQIICVARTEVEGVTLFLVDAQSKGVSQTLLLSLAGDKQSEVIFNQVTVSPSQILGEINRGWDYMDKVLPKAVVAKCAEMVGGAEEVLNMTIQYAKERHQFGRPIGSLQIIQHYCADMLCQVEACKYLTYQAAWLLSEGMSANKETAIAKACCSDAFKKVTQIAHQVHGAIGFTEEHDLHLYYKHAKAWELILGNAYCHRETVAQEMGI
jgi:alkylation response protein AidB-like acyl-CoA dehydrogenase